MRIIASGCCRRQGKSPESPQKLLKKLWKRVEEEDKVLAGIILANVGIVN